MAKTTTTLLIKRDKSIKVFKNEELKRKGLQETIFRTGKLNRCKRTKKKEKVEKAKVEKEKEEERLR